ncbi:MAG: SET domain-containing protein [Pyrinomonadaceae bacterium]
MTNGIHNYVIKRTAHGLGLFTLAPIPAGKRIIEYTGPLVSNEEVDSKPNGKYFFCVNTEWSVDGSPRSNLARYINHSCRPNSEAIVSGRRVWIWSKRAIKAGEELNYDYGKEYFDMHIKPIGCKCAKCAENVGKALVGRRVRKETPH